ncbi:response regulator [Nocardioides sp.]|uniref:response regulator n=1 Tax=Nocardioides sp. TaxID=35761 RepID=UPI0039E66C74
MTRVAILDDHGLFLGALSDYVTRVPGLEVVAALASWTELLAHPAYPAEVVLLDLDLGDELPPAVKIRALRAAGAQVIVVSSLVRPELVLDALEAGAAGYVPKRAELHEITEAIETAAAGGSYVSAELASIALQDRRPSRPSLSDQEQRILALYAAGLPLKSAALRAGVSYHTAKTYLDRIRRKYEEAGRPVRSKVDLHRVAVEDGWMPPG